MKPKIISLDQIKTVISKIDLINPIKEGFIAYSSGRAVVPPVGELLLDQGEVHIKYGYIKHSPCYVVKVASGFYNNPALGLASSNGLILLFSQTTGELIAILLDEGFLTDTRTAVAGAIAAEYLAPKKIKKIGIIGTGTQAKLQLLYLKEQTVCREVLVWGLNEKNLHAYRDEMEQYGFQIEVTSDIRGCLRHCNLIVTTTPAISPLFYLSDVQPGTHITAVGSDTPDKQEFDSNILKAADLVVADSMAQCRVRGEIHHAIKAKHVTEYEVTELGHIISGKRAGRTSEEQLTVIDLTGVAVQDIKVSEAVYNYLTTSKFY